MIELELNSRLKADALFLDKIELDFFELDFCEDVGYRYVVQLDRADVLSSHADWVARVEDLRLGYTGPLRKKMVRFSEIRFKRLKSEFWDAVFCSNSIKLRAKLAGKGLDVVEVNLWVDKLYQEFLRFAGYKAGYLAYEGQHTIYPGKWIIVGGVAKLLNGEDK